MNVLFGPYKMLWTLRICTVTPTVHSSCGKRWRFEVLQGLMDTASYFIKPNYMDSNERP